MCGIAGIINGPNNSERQLNKMLNAIKHRGPDDHGLLIDDRNHVFLGSRRLSILDLSVKGKMPMYNRAQNIAVCQNGEIYNYLDVKAKLIALGYSFKSNSDTEVIVYGYQEWGTDVFNKLDGMFAISIFDKKNNKVILARDRIGIKPLYYLSNDKSIYFSSEMKSFMQIENYSFKGNLDIEMINQLIGFMFLPNSESTIVEGIRKLLPGHVLEISLSNMKTTLSKYWDLPINQKPNTISFNDAVDELDKLLIETVSAHLMSDVPLGILLSGGLDSSLIAAMVKKITKSEVTTFNAKFKHKFNESENAKSVAKYIGTNHQEIFIDSRDVNKNIEKHIIDYDDLTTFDGGLITTKLLCEKIKERGVTVVLLGEGADEIFGGYSWFGLSQFPFSFMPDLIKSTLYYYAISRNLTFNTTFYYKTWINLYKRFHNPDIFRTITEMELKIQLPNHLLMKVDKASMSASVEARVPYLDHKVVEYAYNLPREHKIKGSVFNIRPSNEKHILREVAKRYLPTEVAYRKKRGFMMPMSDVLYSDINKVKDYILSKDSLSQNLIPRHKLENLFNDSQLGALKMQKEYLLWRLFLLEVWSNVYAK